jgi:hypothetical protein
MLSILTLTHPLSSSFGRSFVICLVKTTLAMKLLFTFWRESHFRGRQDILVWENWLKIGRLLYQWLLLNYPKIHRY